MSFEEGWRETDELFSSLGMERLERILLSARAGQAYLEEQRDPISGQVPDEAIEQLFELGGIYADVANAAKTHNVQFKISPKEEGE